MRILVTEHSDHFFLLNYLNKLIPDTDYVEFTFRLRPEQDYWSSIFSTTREVKVFDDTSRLKKEIKFFLHILISGFKTDKIIVNTGPEYESAKLVFLSLCAYFPHRKKTVYMVRNPSEIESSKGKNFLARRMRAFIVKRSHALIFENESVRKRINEILPMVTDKQQAVIYTHSLGSKQHTLGNNEKSEFYVIGLLGAISPERRDYEMFLDAIRKLQEFPDLKLEVVVLGSTANVASGSFIGRLKSLNVSVRFENGWLSDDTFLELGTQCDVLVAPLKFGLKEYGHGGSTGSFGDAIRLRKKLLIPQFADLIGEFSEFSVYYKDSSTLSAGLLSQYQGNRDFEVSASMEDLFGEARAARNLRRMMNSSIQESSES